MLNYPKPAIMPSLNARLNSIQLSGVIFYVKMSIILNHNLNQIKIINRYLWVIENDDDDDHIENQTHDADEKQITAGYLISPNWHQQVTIASVRIIAHHRIF